MAARLRPAAGRSPAGNTHYNDSDQVTSCLRCPVSSGRNLRSSCSSRKQLLSKVALEQRPASKSSNSIQATATEQTPAAPEGSKEAYDVYVADQEPLQEGVEKHVISVFVADESGIINRVAGVFARRGANIESLAVGLNIDKALFTIVVNGTAATVQNLVKQLAKLVKVRYVEDISAARRVERELMLVKLRAPPGPARTEVLQLVDIFRARVVDVSEATLTLMVTGDAGKTAAMQRVLAKFGIIEVARTGKISLKRGEQLLEMGGWGEGLKHQQRMKKPVQTVLPDGTLSVDEGDEGDVYTATDTKSPGVWEVENVLDTNYEEAQPSGFEPHTLSIDVEDRPGVLNQVTGVFSRRGYNVQSLAVGNSEVPGRSRIITVLPGTPAGIVNLIKQLNKLVYVHKVTDLSDMPFVARELMLVKVRCGQAERRELSDLARVFHSSVCDVSLSTVTLEITGKEEKMVAVQELLGPYGILEVARTGRVAMMRDSRVNTRYLEGFSRGRVMV